MISRSASFEFGLDAAAGTVVAAPAATCSPRGNCLGPVAGDVARPVVVPEGLRGGFACRRGAGVVACPRLEPDGLWLARGVERLGLEGAGLGVILGVVLGGVGFGLGGVTREGGGLSGPMGTGSGPAPTAGDATAAAAKSTATHVRWTILWLVGFITASSR